MFFRLIRYDWTLFKAKLTDTETIIGTVIVILFGLILYLSLHNILSIVMFAHGAELPPAFDFITPEIRYFIMLLFVNFWWLSQFIMTGPALLRPDDHRPLLTHGVPSGTLGRYLLQVCWVHPFSLLFNAGWLVLLLSWTGQLPVLLFVLPALALNQLVIFTIKERLYRVMTRRFKQFWTAVFILFILISQVLLPNIDLPQTLEAFQQQIPAYNQWLSLLPGSLLLQGAGISARWFRAVILAVIMVPLAYYLHTRLQEHIQLLLLRVSDSHNGRTRKQHPLWLRIRRLFGYHAGKGLYYVFIHPYARLVFAIGLFFPLFYVPMILNEKPDEMVPVFIGIFLLIPVLYAAMLLFGNMFGFEYDEWLAHKQFPVDIQQQLEERYFKYLYVVFTCALLILPPMAYIKSVTSALAWIPRLLFVTGGLLLLFRWPALHYLKRVEWKMLNFKNPLFPTSIGIAIGILQLLVFGAVLLPYGPLETYKPMILLLASAGIYGYLWMSRDNLSKLFQRNILPRLWNRS